MHPVKHMRSRSNTWNYTNPCNLQSVNTFLHKQKRPSSIAQGNLAAQSKAIIIHWWMKDMNLFKATPSIKKKQYTIEFEESRLLRHSDFVIWKSMLSALLYACIACVYQEPWCDQVTHTLRHMRSRSNTWNYTNPCKLQSVNTFLHKQRPSSHLWIQPSVSQHLQVW